METQSLRFALRPPVLTGQATRLFIAGNERARVSAKLPTLAVLEESLSGYTVGELSHSNCTFLYTPCNIQYPFGSCNTAPPPAVADSAASAPSQVLHQNCQYSASKSLCFRSFKQRTSE
ncbi:hypothetical protein V6N13_023518 [Hibiscus sabdariffa]